MPAICSIAAKLLLIILASGQARLDTPLHVGGTDDMMQYDDGTACWLVWSGLYRGTWFNMDDFGISSWHCVQSEYWFYHHASYPWDVSAFYGEVWNSDEYGPVIQLDQTSLTATHYSPVHVSFSSPGLECRKNVWILVNSEFSAGGWPSLIGDATPNWTGTAHSFFSDDMVEWTPWVPGFTGLNRSTWGSIKTLYGDIRALSSTESCDFFIRFLSL